MLVVLRRATEDDPGLDVCRCETNGESLSRTQKVPNVPKLPNEFRHFTKYYTPRNQLYIVYFNCNSAFYWARVQFGNLFRHHSNGLVNMFLLSNIYYVIVIL
jgi:hypothetical protein